MTTLTPVMSHKVFMTLHCILIHAYICMNTIADLTLKQIRPMSRKKYGCDALTDHLEPDPSFIFVAQLRVLYQLPPPIPHTTKKYSLITLTSECPGIL